MNKPQRKISVNRDSLRGTLRPSSGYGTTKNTPLLRSSNRIPLSAAKSNQRESYIGISNQHAVKDPRSLTDKIYIKRCVVEIIQILSRLNYPTSLTPKQFNPPSSKEYQRVFEFLAFEIMGSFRILGKPDEEMLKALKELGYPYNISKSMLNNVGAMSCWPQALGALMWMADLARYCGGVDDAIEMSLTLNSRKKLKHGFIAQCYSEFMSGNDGPFIEQEDQLAKALEELDADALRTYEKEQINQEKLSAEHKRKVQEKENFYTMAEDIQTKRGNIEKMKKYLQDCDDYINAMKNKAKELEESIKSKEIELTSSKEDLININSQVSQQDLNRADIVELTREKGQLREAISTSTDRLEQLKTTKWDLDVRVGKLALQANELAESFNSQFMIVSSSLSLIRDHLPDFPLRDLSDFSLSTGHKGLENDELLSSKIEPFLTSLNNKMLEILGSLETEYYNTCKRVKQGWEIVADLSKQKEQLQEQHQKLEKENRILTEEIKKSEESYNVKILKAETTLEQLKSAQSESLDDMNLLFNEKKTKVKTTLEKNKRLESREKAALQKSKLSVKKFQETLHQHTEDLVEKMDAVDQEALKRVDVVKSRIDDLLESVKGQEEFFKNLPED